MNVKVSRIAALAAILVWNESARADDPAAADAIFNAAVAARKQGDLDTACAAFAESQRLDPRPGTQHAMAECESEAGRIATAVTLYDDFLRSVANIKSAKEQLRYLDRVKQSQKKREALLKEVPTLIMVLPPGAPAYVRMTRNGEPFTTTLLGIPIPVNPGEHVITVQIASGQVKEQRVTVARGSKQLVELQLPSEAEARPAKVRSSVPLLAPNTSSRGKEQSGGAIALLRKQKPGEGYASVDIPKSEDSRMHVRTAGVLGGGLGVAGLVTGIVSGAVILRRQGIIEANCPDRRCNDAGFEATQGLSALNAANAVGLTLGGAALVAGGLMIGWGNHWLGAKEQPPNLQMGAVVTGKKDAFLGLKGAF